MSGPFLIRLSSNDGTKYNLCSWLQFFGGTLGFIFFVMCGSYNTPLQNLPYIVTCFFISGVALVAAVYGVIKLVTFHRIKVSRSRRDLDDERTADSTSNPTYPDSGTNPIPIPTMLKPILSTPCTPEKTSPTLLGALNSEDSSRSRSWNYVQTDTSCRYRRAFSYDGSSVSSVGELFLVRDATMPDSTMDCHSVVGPARWSLDKECPIYSVPDKPTRNNRSQVGRRSGIEEESDYRSDCITSSTSSDTSTVVASPAYGELYPFEGAARGVSVEKEGRLYHSSHLREHGRVDKTLRRKCRKTHGRWYLGILPDVKERSHVYVGKCRRVSRKELMKIISGVSLSNSASPDMLLRRKSYSNCQYTEV